MAWKILKERLTTAPVLGYPDPEATFVGHRRQQLRDWSRSIPEEEWRRASDSIWEPYPHESRETVLRDATRLLAVVFFTRYYRHYLLGKKFILRTDHASLRWLQSFKEPEGQIARWIETLQNFEFELVHRPGAKHQNADSMSRGPCHQCGGEHTSEKIKGGWKPVRPEAEACAVQTRSRRPKQKQESTCVFKQTL